MARNKLYILLSTACIAGYIWLILTYHRSILALEPSVCFFKHITDVPCPSCGSTRSVLSILNGDFTGALQWNPIGILLVLILIVSPIWILYDVLNRNDTLFRFYNYTESFLNRKKIAIPLILVVTLNWIWNIYKEL